MILVPLLSPNIDLAAFRRIVPPALVNEVDAKLLPPAAKFAALVEASLQPDWAYWHLYEAFFFRMPAQTILEMDGFPHARMFRLTVQGDGLSAEGIVSGPLDLWKEFLQWAANPNNSEFMVVFAKALYGYFRKYDYFKTLTDNVPALR